jgi:hypothetical protein
MHQQIWSSVRDARTSAGPNDGEHSSRQVSSSMPNKRSKQREKRRERQRQENWTAGEGRKINNISEHSYGLRSIKYTPKYQTKTGIDKTSPTNEHQLLNELLTYSSFGGATPKPSSPHNVSSPAQAWGSFSGSNFLAVPGPRSRGTFLDSTTDFGDSSSSSIYASRAHGDIPLREAINADDFVLVDLLQGYEHGSSLSHGATGQLSRQESRGRMSSLSSLPRYSASSEREREREATVGLFGNNSRPALGKSGEDYGFFSRHYYYYTATKSSSMQSELSARRAKLLRHRNELVYKRAKLSDTRKQLARSASDFMERMSEYLKSGSPHDFRSMGKSYDSEKLLRSLVESQELEVEETEETCASLDWKYTVCEQDYVNWLGYGHGTGWFDELVKPVYTAIRSSLFQEEPPDEQEQLIPRTRHSMKRKETPKKMERWYHDFRIEGRKQKETMGPLAPQLSTKDAVSMVDQLETVDELLTRVSWVDPAHGQTSIDVWRNTAGRSKSWRRCPKSVATGASHTKHARRVVKYSEKGFAKSPLWVPSAFVRSGQGPRARHVERPVERRGSSWDSSRMQGADRYGVFDNVEFAMGNSRSCKAPADAESKTPARNHVEADRNVAEPGIAFLRFTWKDKVLTDGIGQLDRFLPTGLQFRAGWRIDGFLRNDSHADVYTLTHIRTIHSKAKPKGRLEAHVFLDEYHGNCAVYAKRQQSRMQESGHCLDIFWYGERRILVMEVAADAPWFRLRNTEEEFPSLVDPRMCMEHAALQRRCLRGKPSFAAIVGKRRPEVGVVRQVRSMPQEKTQLERELEQIEKTRLKKAEKQRAKRRQQRDRRFEQLRSALEDIERTHKDSLGPLISQWQGTGYGMARIDGMICMDQ